MNSLTIDQLEALAQTEIKNPENKIIIIEQIKKRKLCLQ
jgi:hypothetical protein